MKLTRRFGLVTLLFAVTLLLGACVSLRWNGSIESNSHARPAPMPTLVSGDGGLLRPAPLPTVAALETELMISLPTEDQMALAVAPERDLRDLAMRLMPELGEIPLVVNENTPNYEVGDQLEFWAHDMDAARDFLVTAELIYKTDVVYAWVEEGEPVDVEKLVETVDRFSASSYPALRAYFGSEWKPGVDNDPRLHILHATGLGSWIAGYYSSSDQYSRLAQPTSNEKEMFYVDLDWLNSLSGTAYRQYDTVLAHEFQHMIHWYTDMNEETWVGEGLSEFAQDVAGFGPTNSFSESFLSDPDIQLTSWGSDISGNDPHYGAAYLFMVYFAQRFGSDLTRSMVAHPANGVSGINEVLELADTGLTFDDIFADWVVANYADEPDALALDGIYGYRDFDERQPAIEEIYRRYPVERVGSEVVNYGTDYLALRGEGDIVFNFQGATTTKLADLPPTGEPSPVWWSNRGDTSDMRLTRRFDLRGVTPGTSVAMNATLWWDIEDGYDYAYVVASLDGEKWRVLEGTSTTDAADTSAFGPAYTGSSNEWRTEQFDLSPFAGEELYIRFEYVTDDAINGRGLFVQDVSIPAIDYASDFAQGDGWHSEGWIFTDNRLPQRWIVQVMIFEDDELASVERLEVDAQGRATLPIAGLGDGRTAVIAISGAAPVILETASYEYWIDQP